jgi:hypothetical protein
MRQEQMAQEKNSQVSSGGALPYLIGFVGALLVGWWLFPKALYSEEPQPVNFNHPIHLEQGMDCTECHYLRDDGSFNAFPTTEDCAMCHMMPLGDTEAEEKFVTEYVEQEKEVPWLVYQYQPDNVFFSHAAHQDLPCFECHPDVETMEQLPPVERNRISGYSKDTMKMWKCERCHAQSGASNACYVCHN